MWNTLSMGQKNRQGEHSQLNLDNKMVVQYEQPEVDEHCYVHLLWLYLSKLSECSFQEDIMYRKAHASFSAMVHDEPWYTKNPVVHNALIISEPLPSVETFRQCHIKSGDGDVRLSVKGELNF